ncbi:HD domain-containing protein [Candidatus Uhrbacteria bacterium]|mgnify:CR=1 FL=1|jgi:uncharacterized protein|nr:HD domain-containing protein [Candidatus Uhrbacteria bacterium]
MNHDETIQKTITFVKDTLAEAEGGHDWWHISRVWSLAKLILEDEKADRLVVELGALLHDIADSKFHGGNEDVGPEKAIVFLESLDVDTEVISHVENIIRHVSFKGGNHEQAFRSPELDLVQDADRIDAIGAIGIARTFNYGGFIGAKLYDPDIPAKLNMSKEEYKKNIDPTINHFYEKLLLLKDRMNTTAGKTIAEKRHEYMEEFLNQFYREWNGEV